MLPQYFAYITIFTSIFSAYFYIRETLKGNTKPNRVSWTIWFIAPIVASAISFSKGAGISALPIFMAGFIPFLVIIGSFWNKNAYWKLGKLDYICFALSIFAIVSWIFLKEGTLVTICAILADGIAFIPTYVKSWTNPETETLSSYYSGSFNALLSIFTLTAFSFNTAGFATYLFLGNLVEILIVLFRRRYFKAKQ
jgi:hypothetical protein